MGRARLDFDQLSDDEWQDVDDAIGELAKQIVLIVLICIAIMVAVSLIIAAFSHYFYISTAIAIIVAVWIRKT